MKEDISIKISGGSRKIILPGASNSIVSSHDSIFRDEKVDQINIYCCPARARLPGSRTATVDFYKEFQI